MAKFRFMLITVAACGLVISIPLSLGEEDYWTPPGAPGTEAGKMKTLNQVEARTPISSLPFMITNSGSYYLTGSLSGVASSNGIIIKTSDVKLDLNGFALNGVSNSLTGLEVSTTRDNITICNGVIRDWYEYGLNASNACLSVMADIKAYSNGFGGILIGKNSLLKACTAYGNGFKSGGSEVDEGIYAQEYCTVRDCKSCHNKGSGIYVAFSSKVTDCTASENDAYGINAQDYCTVRECTVARNKYDGITVGAKCRVVENNCGENGLGGDGAGIRVEGDSNRIENNNVSGNDWGIQVGGAGYGNLIICNSASDNTISNYCMTTNVLGDHYGQILRTNDLGAEFQMGSAWSNFQF